MALSFFSKGGGVGGGPPTAGFREGRNQLNCSFSRLPARLFYSFFTVWEFIYPGHKCSVWRIPSCLSTDKQVWATNLVHEWCDSYPHTYNGLHAAGFHSNPFSVRRFSTPLPFDSQLNASQTNESRQSSTSFSSLAYFFLIECHT